MNRFKNDALAILSWPIFIEKPTILNNLYMPNTPIVILFSINSYKYKIQNG